MNIAVSLKFGHGVARPITKSPKTSTDDTSPHSTVTKRPSEAVFVMFDKGHEVVCHFGLSLIHI